METGCPVCAGGRFDAGRPSAACWQKTGVPVFTCCFSANQIHLSASDPPTVRCPQSLISEVFSLNETPGGQGQVLQLIPSMKWEGLTGPATKLIWYQCFVM